MKGEGAIVNNTSVYNKVRKNIVLLDNCSYSRIALEQILSHLFGDASVFSFECFSDYKNWNGNFVRLKKDCYIIVNISTTALYGEDIAGFFMYEMNQSDPVGTRRRVLLLMEEYKRNNYCNSIIIHLLMHNVTAPHLSIVERIKSQKLDSIKNYLSQFINDISADKRTCIRLTFCELRALRIILSGKGIKYYSRKFGVNEKTLYSQRTTALNKLGV
jgi:RNA recognition motif-containing protein